MAPHTESRSAAVPGNPFRANPLLAANARASGGGSRRLPFAASVAIHVGVIAGLLALPARITLDAEPPRRIDIVFQRPAVAERSPIAQPDAPPAKPRPVAKAKPSEPPAPRRPDPPVELAPQIARAEPIGSPPQEPASRPAVTRPSPPAPQIRTAVLPEIRSTAVAATPRRQPSTGVFTEARSDTLRRSPAGGAVARVAAFEDAPANAPSRTEEARVVATRVFSDGSESGPRERTSSSRGSVASTGFGDGAVPIPPPRRRERPAGKLDAPVEIVSKPKPIYTEKARELRIEGEIVLEVTFVASGQLRVLRVLERLGHGLDEAAVDAAKRIEFKPARRNGRPIDHTATLRVVFRLA